MNNEFNPTIKFLARSEIHVDRTERGIDHVRMKERKVQWTNLNQRALERIRETGKEDTEEEREREFSFP